MNASTEVVEEALGERRRDDHGPQHVRRRPGPLGRGALERMVGRGPALPHPVFVLTHHEREPLEMEGGTTFHFVTDGIESALEQARDGGRRQGRRARRAAPTPVQQYLAAGLVDEMTLNVAPVLLGAGARLFDDVGVRRARIELVEAIDAPGVTHLKYRFRLAARTGAGLDQPLGEFAHPAFERGLRGPFPVGRAVGRALDAGVAQGGDVLEGEQLLALADQGVAQLRARARGSRCRAASPGRRACAAGRRRSWRRRPWRRAARRRGRRAGR